MTKTVIINTKNAYSMQEILTEFCKTYIIAHADVCDAATSPSYFEYLQNKFEWLAGLSSNNDTLAHNTASTIPMQNFGEAHLNQIHP